MKHHTALGAILVLSALACAAFGGAGVAAKPKRLSGLAPPMTGGVYVDHGGCPGEGCAMSGKIQAGAPVALYDGPGPAAVAVSRLEAGEWVEAVDTEVRLVPARGVVRESGKLPRPLAKGDVVYRLTPTGEGCYDLWRKGGVLDWCDPESIGSSYARIDFDPPRAGASPMVFWVRVKRQTGPGGWIRDVEDIRCGGQMDREGCP